MLAADEVYQSVDSRPGTRIARSSTLISFQSERSGDAGAWRSKACSETRANKDRRRLSVRETGPGDCDLCGRTGMPPPSCSRYLIWPRSVSTDRSLRPPSAALRGI